VDAALAKNLPRRSRSPNGFTHGRVNTGIKDSVLETSITRVKRVKNPLRGSGQRLTGFSPLACRREGGNTPCRTTNPQDFGRGNEQASQHEKIPAQAPGIFRARSHRSAHTDSFCDAKRHFSDSAFSRQIYFPRPSPDADSDSGLFAAPSSHYTAQAVKVVPAQPGRRRSTALAQP
jgi:hypothetical protein